MKSKFVSVGEIELPFVNGEDSMIEFCLKTLEPLTGEYKEIARKMTAHIKNKVGNAFLTVHGKTLKESQTLRRGGPHTDGNYEPYAMTFGGGWKVGENGPAINTELHDRQYNNECGGIILCTNFASAIGWNGEYDGLPNVGGDCSHIELDQPELLKEGVIYYGNNHFIHESLPVDRDVHRVFARVTLPENHVYEA